MSENGIERTAFCDLPTGQWFIWSGQPFLRIEPLHMETRHLAVDQAGRLHAFGATDVVTITEGQPCNPSK